MKSEKKNIVLTGPSGRGKSTVGRILADMLSRPFVDMDQEIERRMGCSISQCFAARGEKAFRDMESNLCEELSAKRGLVIASGGGAIVRSENRAWLESSGILVNLNAPVDDLVSRLERHGNRPLLGEGAKNLKIKLLELLNQRKKVYDAVPVQIDTENLSARQTAQKIFDWVRQSDLD